MAAKPVRSAGSKNSPTVTPPSMPSGQRSEYRISDPRVKVTL